MAADHSLNKEYLPVSGLRDYCEAGYRLLVGEDSPAIQEQKVNMANIQGSLNAFLCLHDRAIGAEIGLPSLGLTQRFSGCVTV